MLIIRRSQFAALESAAALRLRDDLLAHLRERFAPQAQALGDPGLVALVDDGIGRARDCGLDDRHGVSVFLEMMLALAPDFDRAEENAWAREVLGDVRCPGWFKRERLLEQARSRGPAGSAFGSLAGMPVSHRLGP